jgi:hypothetical protein
MIYKNFIFLVIFLCGFGPAGIQAREAILASGGDASGSGGSLNSVFIIVLVNLMMSSSILVGA